MVDAEITRYVVIGDVRNELNSAGRSALVLTPRRAACPLALRLPEAQGRGVGKALAVGVPSTDTGGGACITRPSPASTVPVGEHCKSELLLLALPRPKQKRPAAGLNNPRLLVRNEPIRLVARPGRFRVAKEGVTAPALPRQA